MKDGWGLATDGKVLFGTDGSSKKSASRSLRVKVRLKQKGNPVLKQLRNRKILMQKLESTMDQLSQLLLQYLKRMDSIPNFIVFLGFLGPTIPGIQESKFQSFSLQCQSTIKYVGLSEASASASTIRRAHVVHPLTAIQLEWSLCSRDVEQDIIFTCRLNVLEYYDQTVISPNGSFYIPVVLRVPHFLKVVKRRRIMSMLS